ncbi:MAG: LysM peptidoglycan-binding domain-containing protein [Bacteroidota bacterium]
MIKLNQFFLLLLFSFCVISTDAQRAELNKKDTAQVQWIKGVKYYVYKVEKGETIYSITKRFAVSEEELKKNNPDLKDGLKTKMQLLIPALAAAKMADAEKKPEEKKISKKEIKVGLMLPVNTWKGFIPDSLYGDSMHTGLDEESLSQLEFYEGAMHAVDSLASGNFKVYLRLFDTENDSAHVGLLLKDPHLKELDFIIATGNQNVLKRLNQFSLLNKVVLLTPSLNSSEVMKNNSKAYALSPSSVTQCYEAGKLCAEKFKNSNALVVKSGVSKENDRAIAFVNGWNDNAELKCKNIDYSKGEFIFLLSSMVKAGNNLIFIPSSNEDFVNNIVTKLNDTTDVYKVTLIGIPTWQYFGSIDPGVMENLHTHLFTTTDLDDESAVAIGFRKFFRNEYMTEPAEAAYQGYDAMMLAGKNAQNESLNSGIIPEQKGLFSTYHFKSVNGLNENQYIHMVRYEGYKLVDVK